MNYFYGHSWIFMFIHVKMNLCPLYPRYLLRLIQSLVEKTRISINPHECSRIIIYGHSWIFMVIHV